MSEEILHEGLCEYKDLQIGGLRRSMNPPMGIHGYKMAGIDRLED
jgi:hypothetical protein